MRIAEIVSYSLPFNVPCEHPEEFIVYAARVSNPSNQTNTETSKKLIKYLIKHKHWSPFEMVNVCMEINTTRDIARQILRHRSFSFQEFSQRYANPEELEGLFVEPKECRLQDTKNRQNSIDTDDEVLNYVWGKEQKFLLHHVKDIYKKALEDGVAKEVARIVLPEGLTKSRLYMNGTLRSWIHYCDLRRGNGTQKEHTIVAEACWQELRPIFPNICDAVEGLKGDRA